MASEVGSAYVSIIPTTRGFGSLLGRSMSKDVTRQGGIAGKRFGGAFGGAMRGLAGGALAAVGIGAVVKQAVGLEAEFSQTMNTMAAVANVPQRQIAKLSDLALKMGADTVFSASDAANAMLELAKGGMTAAQIRAGALQQTLTLAAASGEDMATSATIMSNALNTFGLSAKDAPKVTAALAGGANASTASMGSLGQALQQVGPGAVNAGLSVQETVAALAAFDNAGIKGSDAGTSLKTMLTRLVPSTAKAAKSMRELGLDFTDAEGNFLPITKVAEQLHRALGPLSDDARTKALTSIFGSDASRAASVFAKEGAAGIQTMIKATSDLGAANRVAEARMKGTAGAIEQLKGSLETAQLRIGQALAPAIQAGANALTGGLNSLATQIPAMVARLTNPFGTFQTKVVPKLRAFGGYLKNDLGPALVTFAQIVGPAVRDSFVSMARSVRSVIGAFTAGKGSAAGFGQTLVTAIPLAARLIAAGLKIAALNVRILTTAFRVLTYNIRLIGSVAVPVVRFFTTTLLNAFGFIVSAAARAFGWVPGLGPKLKAAAAKFAVFKAQVEASLTGFGATGFKLGANFSAGLARGIAASGTVAQATAVGVANKVAAGIRSGQGWDMHSPSKVATVLGAQFGQGLALGIRRSQTGVTRSATGLASTALKPFAAPRRAAIADVRTGHRPGGSVQLTVNNPLPERASESTANSLRRLSWTHGLRVA